jgi:hypothetical protein
MINVLERELNTSIKDIPVLCPKRGLKLSGAD